MIVRQYGVTDGSRT